MNKSINRRNFLKTGAMASGMVVGIASLAKAGGQCLGATPAQTEGPFYPVDDQFDKDSDLTWIKGHNKKAEGEVVIILGTVRDQNCQPVASALVEIWQACKSGKYNHPSDENPAPLDPNFQYWGKCTTDEKGVYKFKTIIPGAYPAAPGWVRPPHVHFKVHKKGFAELTTQMYFAGEPLNLEDKILQRLSTTDQSKVIVRFEDTLTYGETMSGTFNLEIEKI